jgi:hypothetical protein
LCIGSGHYGGEALVSSRSAGKNPGNFFYNIRTNPQYGFEESLADVTSTLASATTSFGTPRRRLEIYSRHVLAL